jgi:hypothetical protein
MCLVHLNFHIWLCRFICAFRFMGYEFDEIMVTLDHSYESTTRGYCDQLWIDTFGQDLKITQRCQGQAWPEYLNVWHYLVQLAPHVDYN